MGQALVLSPSASRVQSGDWPTYCAVPSNFAVEVALFALLDEVAFTWPAQLGDFYAETLLDLTAEPFVAVPQASLEVFPQRELPFSTLGTPQRFVRLRKRMPAIR